jgi:MoxR-like ATPase
MSLAPHDSAEQRITVALQGEPENQTVSSVDPNVAPLDVSRTGGRVSQNRVTATLGAAVQHLVATAREVTAAAPARSPVNSPLGATSVVQ